ncbi:hypothetical protein ACS0TY_007697 [Phlomoides rotata]
MHRSAVTILRYNNHGSLLASGSKGCDIILWDVIGEVRLFRLQGHREQVTDLVFLDSSKKIWTWILANLDTEDVVSRSIVLTKSHDVGDVESFKDSWREHNFQFPLHSSWVNVCIALVFGNVVVCWCHFFKVVF